ERLWERAGCRGAADEGGRLSGQARGGRRGGGGPPAGGRRLAPLARVVEQTRRDGDGNAELGAVPFQVRGGIDEPGHPRLDGERSLVAEVQSRGDGGEAELSPKIVGKARMGLVDPALEGPPAGVDDRARSRQLDRYLPWARGELTCQLDEETDPFLDSRPFQPAEQIRLFQIALVVEERRLGLVQREVDQEMPFELLGVAGDLGEDVADVQVAVLKTREDVDRSRLLPPAGVEAIAQGIGKNLPVDEKALRVGPQLECLPEE